MEQIFIQNQRRQSYKAFVEFLKTQKPLEFDETTALIMPMVLRVHKALAAGLSKYSLDLGVGTANLLAVENKLQKNDIAILTNVALGIQKYDPASPDFDKPIMHAEDPVYFGANPSKALSKIYHGKSSLKSGSQVRIDGLSNLLFRYNPGDGFAGTVAAPTDFPQYGPENENRGFYDLGAFQVLYGENQNIWEVELASGDTTNIVDGATAANSNNLVFLGLGWVYRGQSANGVGQCGL